MCFMCDIKKRMAGGGGDAEGGFQFPGIPGMSFEVVDLRKQREEQRELKARTLDAVRAHAGDRAWVHGFLFRFCLDREQLIEMAESLGVDPAPFVAVDPDGAESIKDWPAVYEAVVDAATPSFEKHCQAPRAEAADSFSDLITVLCGKALDAEQRWIDSMRN